MFTLTKSHFSRGFASHLRAVHISLSRIAESVSGIVGSDISVSDITDYRNGLQEPSVDVISAIARTIGKSPAYIDHLGFLEERLHSGGDRDSIMFAAGVYFSSNSRNWDERQLARNIVDRGGIDLRTAMVAIEKMSRGDRLDGKLKQDISQAFNVPPSNLEWIGYRLFSESVV